MNFVQLCRQYTPCPYPAQNKKNKNKKEKKKKKRKKKKQKKEKKRKGKKSLVLSGAGCRLGTTDGEDLWAEEVRREQRP